MMEKTLVRILLSCVLVLILPCEIIANDGYLGVSVGGLTFQHTDDIAMKDEDLYLSLDTVRVRYVFENVSSSDVTAAIGFPMPDLVVIPDYDDLNRHTFFGDEATDPFFFRTWVNGEEISTRATTVTARILTPLFPSESNEKQELVDVTSRIQDFGFPLSLDSYVVGRRMEALSEEELEQLVALDLVRLSSMSIPGSDPPRPTPYPNWFLTFQFSWEQEFPAGRETVIEHQYRPMTGGSKLWVNEPTKSEFCIDDESQAEINRIMEERSGLHMESVPYILETANSWAGPIGRFRLTIDRGRPDVFAFACLDIPVVEVGATTIRAEAEAFVPTQRLEVLFIVPH
ncbi:MAG: DUF4424 family protein [Candidatus Eisenbacteria bacterium]|uniref:DUF4424 family protein n=1 Tax=Eiseniibacteriota bacterium TaxID=2212470 RepID=A0A956NLD5_UNCEI|nr:DUF4424 family protein [Candidatus Eisenbacteria bacterium]